MATAIQLASLVSNVVSPDSNGPVQNSDRIDLASTTASNSDLDVAMGTMMAYGGKYLREMAVWAYEYGTQTPLGPLGNTGGSSSSVAQSR
jgi:hypothetical protein